MTFFFNLKGVVFFLFSIYSKMGIILRFQQPNFERDE